MRKNPWDACVNHARLAAEFRFGVVACPYRGAWRTKWLQEFEKAQQKDLFAGSTAADAARCAA